MRHVSHVSHLASTHSRTTAYPLWKSVVANRGLSHLPAQSARSPRKSIYDPEGWYSRTKGWRACNLTSPCLY